MKLVLQTLDKKTFDVEVDDNATLGDLKKKVEELKNHPIAQIKLIFSGAVLNENDKKLTDYKLVNDSRVIVLLSPKPATSQAQPAPQAASNVQPAPSTNSVTTQTPAQNQFGNVPSQPPVNLFDMAANAANNAQAGAGGAQGLQQTLTQMLASNPQILMQMLMSNPQIAQFAGQNPQAFLQMVSNPDFLNNIVEVGDQYEEASEFEGMYDNLTDDQKKDVDEMINMGFDFNDIIQYYCLNDHNKEATINILLNQQLDENQ
ncbi:ubiquitin protein [Fadolivirus algeromassiliense]|jgi:UV excision repair protein RAD23|uniref:Ubiquitin protein n=1 Tax=Fadolivirus FV1/VV64 TaxID=3070911 RepID=A0A7D3UUS9_9VIRU|nr:ubiquitin protein [Fadolivirus algeromassiliense]QKF93689.1 ubiquitin protein [Fadolivirus FV1/VV64]